MDLGTSLPTISRGETQVSTQAEPSAKGRPSTRLAAFDGVRGLGALMVVFGHASYGSDIPFWVPTLMDMFFMYSGLFITQSLMKTDLSQKSISVFYRKRMIRIWPLYFTIVVGSFLLNAWMLHSNQGPKLDYSGAAIVRYLSFLQYVPRYWGGTELSGGILEHTWSLAVEEQFYLFWPLLLILIRHRPRTAVAVMMSLVFISIALRYAGLNSYLFLGRIDSFVLGTALGWLIMKRKSLPVWVSRQAWPILFGVLAAICLCILIDGYTDILGGKQVLHIGADDRLTAGIAFKLFYILVLAGMLWKPDAPAYAPLRFVPFVYAGRLCYPIYMIHYPVLLFGGSAIAHAFGSSWNTGALLMIPIVLLLAHCWFIWVDTPIERWQSGHSRVLPNPTAS